MWGRASCNPKSNNRRQSNDKSPGKAGHITRPRFPSKKRRNTSIPPHFLSLLEHSSRCAVWHKSRTYCCCTAAVLAVATMIQSLFVMSKTGEVMIEKHWRGITPRNVCDFFWDEVNRHDVPEAVPPILQVLARFVLVRCCARVYTERERETLTRSHYHTLLNYPSNTSTVEYEQASVR